MIMWIHPAIQAVAMLLACYVMFLGVQRFRFQHLKARCKFDWKLHVLLGKVVLGIWTAGCLLGLYMAYHAWGSVDLTGPHYLVGVTMLPFIAVGLVTGLVLQKPKGKRAGLALLHGVCNGALFLMALFQGYSGVEVIKLFLLD